MGYQPQRKKMRHERSATTVHSCAQLCTVVHRYAQVCTGVHRCAHSSVQTAACTIVHSCAQVCTQQCAQLCAIVHSCAQVCRQQCADSSVHNCAKLCTVVHRCAHRSGRGGRIGPARAICDGRRISRLSMLSLHPPHALNRLAMSHSMHQAITMHVESFHHRFVVLRTDRSVMFRTGYEPQCATCVY